MWWIVRIALRQVIVLVLREPIELRLLCLRSHSAAEEKLLVFETNYLRKTDSRIEMEEATESTERNRTRNKLGTEASESRRVCKTGRVPEHWEASAVHWAAVLGDWVHHHPGSAKVTTRKHNRGLWTLILDDLGATVELRLAVDIRAGGKLALQAV